jgi:large subunit ribosomal protein L20
MWFINLVQVLDMQVNYGQFMHGLSKENINLNRKVLSEIAMHEPYSFKSLVDLSRIAFTQVKIKQ